MSANFKLMTSVLAVVALQACSPQPADVSPKPTFKLTASVQDIMRSIVDPAADALWESVEVTVTKKGEVVKEPKTEAEWKTVRSYALTLAESANLLAIDGRKLVHEGQTLEDSHVKGILTSAEIEAKINADRGSFVTRAKALQVAAETALVAIDAKDVKRLVEAGGDIDHACEQCHQVYWYPNDTRPTSFPSTPSQAEAKPK